MLHQQRRNLNWTELDKSWQFYLSLIELFHLLNPIPSPGDSISQDPPVMHTVYIYSKGSLTRSHNFLLFIIPVTTQFKYKIRKYRVQVIIIITQRKQIAKSSSDSSEVLQKYEMMTWLLTIWIVTVMMMMVVWSTFI